MTAAPAAVAGEVSSLEESYAHCLRLCRSHYENFPVASRRIPPSLRGPVAAVYAFARTADDFADEPGFSDEERLRELNDWRRRLNDGRAGRHDYHPIFWALSDVIDRFHLPLKPFDNLISAFQLDVMKNRHASFDDLLAYCRLSANPVGEIVLRLFGEWNETRGAWSDAICTALQLANFWQDVTVDALKNRIYVPLDDMRTLGVSENDVLKGPAAEALRELMAHQVDRTWTLFRRGRPLCDDVSPALQKELRLVWLGGTRILQKIESRKWDVWSHRPKLGPADWAALLPALLFWKKDKPIVPSEISR